MKVALVSCTKLKQNNAYQAKDMYLPSQLFKKARYYIENNYSNWYILSAKYGLLHIDQIIEPYDMTLNTMKANEIKTWSENIFKQLPDNITHVDFYAGEKYRKYLIPLLEERNISYSIPLKGLGIGQQMQWYKNKRGVN